MTKPYAWVVAGVCLMTQVAAEAAPIAWKTTRSQAVAAAQSSGKRILLLAGRNSCGNTQFMKTDMCERAGIRQVLDAHYVPWYCIVDTADDWSEYASGLGGFTLPLICVINPNDSLHYLDRTTNLQSNEAAFRARLLSHVTAAAGDDYEPDNAVSAAKKIARDQTQKRSIRPVGDVDFVKFAVGLGGAKNVRVKTAGTSGDTQVWVYKGRTGPLVGYDDNSGVGSFSRVFIASLTQGTYFIKIRDYGNNSKIPAYTLKVTWDVP